MQRNKTANRTIDILFLLVLFCVFTVAILLVLTTGAGAYQSVTEKMNSQYTERTAVAYIEAKLRHYDELGGIDIQPFGEGEALVLKENVDGVSYKTLIYYYKGYIRELFCEEGLYFQPQDGETVIPAGGLTANWKAENLLEVLCTNTEGRTERLLFYNPGEETERERND